MSYITDVANLFFIRCEREIILNPSDYALIAEWEKQEIPLQVVLDSINQTFDEIDKINKPINIDSLEYFRSYVKKNYAVWLQKF